MNRISKFFLSILIVAIFLALVSSYKAADPVQNVSTAFENNNNDVLHSLDELKQKAKDATEPELGNSYTKCRYIYKRFEFLLYYLDPQEVSTFINGAPLPKVASDNEKISVIEPCGFQRIDELAGEAALSENREELIKLIDDLTSHCQRLFTYAEAIPLTDRHVIESMRQGIVSLTTLGMSGFDTPGTNSSLIDASVVLLQMKWCFDQYKGRLEASGYDGFDEISTLFFKGLDALDQPDFESFDRFTFTRDILNPLSARLLEIQKSLHVEFRDEVEEFPVAVNYRSAHLFSSDFLNLNYFGQTSGYRKTEDMTELGRTLFFDPILSAKIERACASCHNPARAFSENKPTPLAFNMEGSLNRNAMTLANAIYSDKYFYDLRAGDLYTQFEHVFLNEKEFNTTYPEVVKKINDCATYRERFNKVFGLKDKPVRKEEINVALATYIASLQSFNSPFDRMMRAEISADVNVVQGYNLFMGKAKCGTCHFPPTFAGLRPPDYVDMESEVLGVTATEDFDHPVPDPDPGRYASGRPKDLVDFQKNAFKTVTVRNVQLSGPYFHNGAFNTLEKVMEFYKLGGGAGLGLDVPNQTLPFDSLQLDDSEINHIINFLHSLTDVGAFAGAPAELPLCTSGDLADRKVGGKY